MFSNTSFIVDSKYLFLEKSSLFINFILKSLKLKFWILKETAMLIENIWECFDSDERIANNAILVGAASLVFMLAAVALALGCTGISLTLFISLFLFLGFFFIPPSLYLSQTLSMYMQFFMFSFSFFSKSFPLSFTLSFFFCFFSQPLYFLFSFVFFVSLFFISFSLSISI